MEAFTYSYPVKTYFGKGAAPANLPTELAKVGPNVLLAYGAVPSNETAFMKN